MHNSPLANKEFELQFALTNLVYWNGAKEKTPEILSKIEHLKELIARLEVELENLRSAP